MGKLNLSEAAKMVLEGSKETFDANIKSKQGMRGEGGSKPEVGMNKPMASVAYGEKDAGVIGCSPEKEDDSLPDYLKGTPSATPPGATPPVGSEKDGVGYSSLKGQPQETMGRSELKNTVQTSATDYAAIRDRIMGKMPHQTMMKNPGATFQAWENVDPEDEDLEELDENSAGMAEIMAAAKKMKKAKKAVKMKMKEDIAALIAGEDLSEEFTTRATTIFEAAVIARAEEIVAITEAQLIEQFEDAVETVKNDLAEKVDGYLNYMVQEWMEENKIALESALRAEIMEDFITGLRNLFVEHYIDIPEEKVDVVEGLTSRVAELEEELNEQINSAVEMMKELNEHYKNEAIYAACEGLTQTQVEKLKSLAEGVEFTTEEEFYKKLDTLVEAYFTTGSVKTSNSGLDDEVLFEEEEKKAVKSFDPLITEAVKAISKTTIK